MKTYFLEQIWTDKFLVVASRYFSIIVGFVGIKTLLHFEMYETIVLFTAMQALSEIVGIADFGNKNRTISGHYTKIKILIPCTILFFVSLAFFIFDKKFNLYSSLLLLIYSLAYPLSINSSINLYERHFKRYYISSLIGSFLCLSLWILYSFGLITSEFGLVFSVLLIQAYATGVSGFHIKNFSLTYKIDRSDIIYGLKASMLYLLGFIGVNSIYYMNYDAKTLAFVTVTLKIISTSHIFAINQNMFASEHRNNNKFNISILEMKILLIQSFLSVSVFWLAVYTLFTQFSSFISAPLLILVFLLASAQALTSKENAFLLANNMLGVFIVVDFIGVFGAIIFRYFVSESEISIICSIFIFYISSFLSFLFVKKFFQL